VIAGVAVCGCDCVFVLCFICVSVLTVVNHLDLLGMSVVSHTVVQMSSTDARLFASRSNHYEIQLPLLPGPSFPMARAVTRGSWLTGWRPKNSLGQMGWWMGNRDPSHQLWSLHHFAQIVSGSSSMNQIT
jgi:hypothetical protein